MNVINGASNPSAMLSQMMNNNPDYAKAQKLIEESGGDAKAAFYKLAENNGINPDEILSLLR